MSRIAILEKDKCQPKKCNYACIEYCPGVRMEEDTIIISEDDKKPEIFIQAVLMDRINKILHYASLLINTFNK